jgi:arylsulfatase A-like enzyme
MKLLLNDQTKYFLIFFLISSFFISCKETKTKKPVVTQKQNIEKKKPNILFISIDDLNTTTGYYGNTQIKTPNIDKLASHGTAFINNHCQQALCGPSRASILSGLRPDNTKVWELFTQVRKANPEMVSLPEYLRKYGYETGGSGKVFDGSTVDAKRDSLSWSIPFVKPKGTRWLEHNEIDRFAGVKKGVKNVPTEAPDLPESEFLDAKIVDEGLKILDTMVKGDKPFFLAVGIKKPHLPFVAPKKYWDLYNRDSIKIAEVQEFPKSIPSFHFQPSWELRSGYAPIPKTDPLPVAMQKELKHGYYACISHADHQVGRLLDALDKLGIRDNTIVILWSDHGYHLGDHGMWNKFTDLEQSTATPLLISAPGYTLNNKTNSPTELVDVFPTVCDLIGIEAPSTLDGVSLLPILKNGKEKVKDFAVTQYHRTTKEGIKLEGYSLRTEHYRYTEWVKDLFKSNNGKYSTKNVYAAEFYDYQADPLERNNLINDKNYKSVIDSLKGYMTEYFRSQNKLSNNY